MGLGTFRKRKREKREGINRNKSERERQKRTTRKKGLRERQEKTDEENRRDRD